MGTDLAVKGISVQDVTGVNGAFQPTAQKRVTFYIGTSGPFFLTYDLKDYNADRVVSDIQKEVDTLKSISAIQGA